MVSFPVRAHGSTPAPDHVSWSLESGFTAKSALAVSLLNYLLAPRKPWPTRSPEDKFLPQAGDDSQPHCLLRTPPSLPSLTGGCSWVFSRPPCPCVQRRAGRADPRAAGGSEL
jgi:hypothetical protein